MPYRLPDPMQSAAFFDGIAGGLVQDQRDRRALDASHQTFQNAPAPQNVLSTLGALAPQLQAIGSREGGAPSYQPATSSGPAKPFRTQDPVASDLPVYARAFLNSIAGGESGGRYDIRYTPQGGATFTDLSRHPGIMEPGPHGKSSAAGRYQFTQTTWNGLGGGEFSPEMQDRRAWELAQRDYRARTGGDLASDLQANGLTDRTLNVLTPTWQALKSNRGRHIATYNDSLSRYGSAAAPAGVQVASADGSGPSAETMDALMSGVNTSRASRGEAPLPSGPGATQTAPTQAPAMPTQPAYQSPDIGGIISSIASGQTQPANFTREQWGALMQSELTRPTAMALWQARVTGDPQAGERAFALALDLDARNREIQQQGLDNDYREREFAASQIPDPVKPPSSVQEYQFAVGQGFQGSFADWEQQNRRAGATNVNVGANGSKFNEETEKAAAARLGDIVAAGNGASQFLGDIQQLAALGQQIQTGLGAQALVKLGPYADALGFDVEGLGPAQAYEGIISRLAPQMRPAGSGAASDFDARQFLQALPTLGNSPEGNKILTDTFQAIQQNKIQAAEIASLAMIPADQGGITWQEAERQIRSLPNPYERFKAFNEGFTQAQPADTTARDASGVPVGGQAAPVRATNPQTGETVEWNGQTWVPVR